MIRVLVVAASPVLRVGLSAMLTANPKLTLISSVPDLDSLETESIESQPDVVLLDLSTNFQQSVWEKLLYLQQQQYSAPFIVITDEIDNIDIETALRSGVQGILPETSTESEILAAVEAVAFGLVVLHPDVLEYLLPLKESSLNRKVLTNPVQALTPREIEGF
uniref:response regulator transcription factor n=1 Tax=Aetokthonos hydrillicola TaxID=1550245 RepID=UPI001ABB222B